MEFPNEDKYKKPATKSEESKIEIERFSLNGSKEEEQELGEKNIHSRVAQENLSMKKPNDVRNGDLVSLLLAATPPYLYNIPLVPESFFFSEMLKSFVQAKVERQTFRAQQTQGRRQRKRSWKEMMPPRTLSYESRDKPLELTIPKHINDSHKEVEVPAKKYQMDMPEKKYQNSKFGSSDFSVEKLADSSITSNGEIMRGGFSGDLVPPAPPLWYPLLYPPHPPYGIDPLHFFIDLRVGKVLEVEPSAPPDEN